MTSCCGRRGLPLFCVLCCVVSLQLDEGTNCVMEESIHHDEMGLASGLSLLQREAVAHRTALKSTSAGKALGTATTSSALKTKTRKPKKKTAGMNASQKHPTGASLAGVKSDKPGDLKALLSAVVADGIAVLAIICIFVTLRMAFPVMYSYNTMVLKALERYQPSDIGWVSASLRPSLQEIVHIAGLDQAMLIEFFHFGMRVMLFLGIPLIAVACTMFWAYGGEAAGEDNLSKISLNNIQPLQESKLWLWYAVALMVWYVVLMMQMLIFNAQRNFLTKRFDWLRAMPKPRATTILVENIPAEYCTDEKLKDYFDKVFGKQVVEKAYVVRDTNQLLRYVDDLKVARQELDRAQFHFNRTGQPLTLTQLDMEHLGEEKDSITHYTDEVRRLQQSVRVEQERIRKITSHESDDAVYQEVAASIYKRSGFVTFYQRRDSEMAVKLRLTPDEDEFCVSIPPDPSDVIYYDLQIDERVEASRETLGYACIAGLFWGYLPLVIGAVTLASQETLKKHSPRFEDFMTDNPSLASAWDGLMGVLVLTLFMSFLPTFFSMIFYRFFTLKAEAWLQARIQQWCFYFLVIFVLLITAIGSSFVEFLKAIVENPLSIVKILATTLPGASHFYLNYFPMQMVTLALVLLRYFPLSKFLTLRAIVPIDRARELAEPEDQDYYGIGFRSAMSSLMMTIALVYCTVNPVICILGFFYFAFARVVYGYLIVYAETIKADLGGVFWCQQLKHLQQSLFIYVALMSGVLLERSTSYGPCFVCAMSLAFLIPSYIRFDHKFHWESLPFNDILEDHNQTKRVARRDTYEQPEISEELEKTTPPFVATAQGNVPDALVNNGIADFVDPNSIRYPDSLAGTGQVSFQQNQDTKNMQSRTWPPVGSQAFIDPRFTKQYQRRKPVYQDEEHDDRTECSIQ